MDLRAGDWPLRDSSSGFGTSDLTDVMSSENKSKIALIGFRINKHERRMCQHMIDVLSTYFRVWLISTYISCGKFCNGEQTYKLRCFFQVLRNTITSKNDW